MTKARAFPVWLFLGLALLPGILTGCTPQQTGPDPLRKLKPFGAVAGFAIGGPETGWVLSSEDIMTDGTIEAVTHQSIPAIEVTTGKRPFYLYHRTQSLLTVTPYLSWTWKLGEFQGPVHPVKIVVGLIQGTDDSNPARRGLFKSEDDDHPDVSHRISFIWSDRALQRGQAEVLIEQGKASSKGRYVAHGGHENLNHWHLETVDLLSLTQRLWPEEDPTRFSVVFLGLEADITPASTKSYLSGLLLNR